MVSELGPGRVGQAGRRTDGPARRPCTKREDYAAILSGTPAEGVDEPSDVEAAEGVEVPDEVEEPGSNAGASLVAGRAKPPFLVAVATT